jgi:hypothetical protein
MYLIGVRQGIVPQLSNFNFALGCRKYVCITLDLSTLIPLCNPAPAYVIQFLISSFLLLFFLFLPGATKSSPVLKTIIFLFLFFSVQLQKNALDFFLIRFLRTNCFELSPGMQNLTFLTTIHTGHVEYDILNMKLTSKLAESDVFDPYTFDHADSDL